ncbi:unnamed protein product [Caenorhabditis bovis]|uniref:Chloride channel protein n=1 Tax=Caenorhabditis bovis TaxID=2654633 RepID=A0A8S1FBF6_9PELO|nr:unnamed protein product [Caenorhabditis bovis]
MPDLLATLPPFALGYRTEKYLERYNLTVCQISGNFEELSSAITCFLLNPVKYARNNLTISKDLIGDGLCGRNPPFTLNKHEEWTKVLKTPTRKVALVQEPLERFARLFIEHCETNSRCFDCKNDISCVLRKLYKAHQPLAEGLAGNVRTFLTAEFSPQSWNCHFNYNFVNIETIKISGNTTEKSNFVRKFNKILREQGASENVTNTIAAEVTNAITNTSGEATLYFQSEGWFFYDSKLLKSRDISMQPPRKEYDYERSFHLGGTYRTVRGPSTIDSMGFDTKKFSDGLEIPLTYPVKNKPLIIKEKLLAKCKRFYMNVIRDWIFLALLGFIMAALSFSMDFAILWLQNGQMLLYELVQPIHVLLAIIVWVGYVVGLTVSSALFAHFIAPQAIGSGIPEMKTILRGVILKEYLSIRTLISKMAGLTMSLGSGLPMGKEGPFVHVASVVAAQLSRLVHGSSTGIFENETRSAEMLAAGCAVGVACTFSAPIGGVLFSIEVTSVYFAVRNYWRGFFAATCSATLFRILRMFSVSDSVTVEAHFQTTFPPQNAFMPQELPVFALIGLICGLLGSAFVYIHRKLVLFLRRNSVAKAIFSKNWIIYPICVATFVSSLTFPMGLGRFMGGQERFTHTIHEFLINCTWTAEPGNIAACPTPSENVSFDIHHWKGDNMNYSIFVTLSVFQVVYFFFTILASTLPVPSGIFMPVFVLGASFGRLVGEAMFQWFPNGFIAEEQYFVRPGIYAVVGAAAFCGAVTHTVSVAVIVFELTGQLCSLLPVMIAVLIANAIASYLQPSMYDSIIRIKNLPYLPDIPHTSSFYHQMLIDQFMITPVVFISKDFTLGDVKKVLESNSRIRAFPLVESIESLALIGSVSRSQIQRLVDAKIGTKARFAEATRRVKERIEKEEEERKKKEEEKSMAEEGSPVPNIDRNRRPSRFLIVPVSQNGSESKRNSIVEGLKPSDARKILSDEQKQALFDASARNNAGKTLQAVASSHDLESHHTFSNIFRSITQFSFAKQSDAKKTRTEFELYGEERFEWERKVLAEPVDLSDVAIDSTPFQLSEYTSLFKVHSLFSLLGLNRAYVTKKGQLIGVVGLKELRAAMEYLQSGNIPTPGYSIFDDHPFQPPVVTITHESIKRHSVKRNEGFIGDSGEADATEDYIQPPIEIIRSGALTPNRTMEIIDIDGPRFKLGTQSTTAGSSTTTINELEEPRNFITINPLFPMAMERDMRLKAFMEEYARIVQLFDDIVEMKESMMRLEKYLIMMVFQVLIALVAGGLLLCFRFFQGQRHRGEYELEHRFERGTTPRGSKAKMVPVGERASGPATRGLIGEYCWDTLLIVCQQGLAEKACEMVPTTKCSKSCDGGWQLMKYECKRGIAFCTCPTYTIYYQCNNRPCLTADSSIYDVFYDQEEKDEEYYEDPSESKNENDNQIVVVRRRMK